MAQINVFHKRIVRIALSEHDYVIVNNGDSAGTWTVSGRISLKGEPDMFFFEKPGTDLNQWKSVCEGVSLKCGRFGRLIGLVRVEYPNTATFYEVKTR